MRLQVLKYGLLSFLLALALYGQAQRRAASARENFLNPPHSAKPWVFWYWMHGAISKPGITADLEAMQRVGIGGAYLMPIKDTSSAIPFQPTARQLSPEWWSLVHFAMSESKRLGLQLGMHVSDGFALAGGPWITPELSMQKLVWSKSYIKGGSNEKIILPQPETKIDYYKDIAVFAYPANSIAAFEETVLVPTVTTSNGVKAAFLSFPNEDREIFRSDSSCWIMYKYPRNFTCRSIRIKASSNNYQAQRLIVQASEDGNNFRTITRLEPPRHGWQDTDEDVTHAIPVTTAKYFRFVYYKDGSEPGAEDLDAAKWRPTLRVAGIYLSDEPVINQYESKNGSMWRISRYTLPEQVPANLVVSLDKIINLSDKLDSNGQLNWSAPSGNWTIVRIGHTSSGHTNATGGGGKGLECDKFNPNAIKLQFDNWFARAFEKTDPRLASEILKLFHVDSWECGSQNWSQHFPLEFKKRRGYDIYPYLLAMAGVPVGSLSTSEKFLHDVRQTIAEQINDIFYATLRKLAAEKGCLFSAESVAPTMMSDGLLHYKQVDVPMGEFWLNSPTHDKPNDMLDAISGAHIYGKKIIQAEAFTSIRMNWAEHPGQLKSTGDRNLALGINKMVMHVFTHNPWLDRKPGMTLDGIGLYFQRDQTWFDQSKAWMQYFARCQAVLQMGKPVADIAVFIGEELPRRSLLPDRLTPSLPGIIGARKVNAEKLRLANVNQPQRTIPDGVSHSANIADPEDWIDPLHGYAYDSFNPDALLNAKVSNGRLVLPGGSEYSIAVIPYTHRMQPNEGAMSLPVARKILQLLKQGATILMDSAYTKAVSLADNEDSLSLTIKEIISRKNQKGKLVDLPYYEANFNKYGVSKDIELIEGDSLLAWTHRKIGQSDFYFLSNQQNTARIINLSLRISGKQPEIWDPVTGSISNAARWYQSKGRTHLAITFDSNQSLFVVFTNPGVRSKPELSKIGRKAALLTFNSNWEVRFDPAFGGPANPVVFPELRSWSQHTDSSIKFYSGTAIYQNRFTAEKKDALKKKFIEIDAIYDIATVKINGIDCGTIWTKPYSLDITKAVRTGDNRIEIIVSNTWHNRLIRDNMLPVDKRVTWTNAPFRLRDKPLLPGGLAGNIKIMVR